MKERLDCQLIPLSRVYGFMIKYIIYAATDIRTFSNLEREALYPILIYA